jgi:hypothetical protein
MKNILLNNRMTLNKIDKIVNILIIRYIKYSDNIINIPLFIYNIFFNNILNPIIQQSNKLFISSLMFLQLINQLIYNRFYIILINNID